MSSNLSKIELLAMIKQYNKNNNDKIKNIDKMKKEEIVHICEKYEIIPRNIEQNSSVKINLSNISKKYLLQDIELFFLKKGKPFPKEIQLLKKEELVEFMEDTGIEHYTQSMITEEIKKYNEYNHQKNIIYYNMMCYDNINVCEIDNDNLDKFIRDNTLDTKIENLKDVSLLLSNIYSSLEEFCKNTKQEYTPDKFKSFPKVLKYIDTLITKR